MGCPKCNAEVALWDCGNHSDCKVQPDACRLREQQAEIKHLRKRLTAIREYGRDGPRSTEDGYPTEFVYDEFAYKRIVDSYRKAAGATDD